MIVVGGGAAGWLTALKIKKLALPTQKVIVIESEEIGILGAGEGSTPALPHFLFEVLGISFYDFYKKCGATFKLGINFENWNGDGKRYFHSFIIDKHNKKLLTNLNENIPYIENCDFYRNLRNSPYAYNKVTKEYDKVLPYAFHFDAHLLAAFLREEAIKRGIIRIEGKVNSIVNDERNYIKEIGLEDGQKIPCSFVFDCTGFKRLIIGKHYKSPWVSYDKYLPAKKALPFQLKIDPDNFNNCTDAIALKYGWMWKIPLNHRYGCGYVFDSDYINADQAKQEVEELLGHEVTVPRVLSFTAGYYEKACINNCIAIGLAAGFTEPIEATSVWIQVLMLDKLGTMLKDIYDDNQESKNTFNGHFVRINDNVLAGLQLHYHVKRNDSIFWKEFNQKNTTVDIIADVFQRNKFCALEEDTYINSGLSNFGLPSWLMLMEGQGIINKSFYPRNVEEIQAYPDGNVTKMLADTNREPLMPTSVFNNTLSPDWKINDYPLKSQRA